jgi:molybdate transport system substrate-binding protein
MRSLLQAILLGALVLAAPARGEEGSVTVYAAASLTEAVGAVAKRFEAARVQASFGSSSELARQIQDGAPADVFLSASPDWMRAVAEAGKLAGEPVVFARGELVCIAARGSELRARGAVDPASLLEKGLAPGDRVAIADAGVPAGEYARQALANLGLADAYRPRLVGQKDVRAVLNAVSKGELPVGFVYATDARVADVERLFAFDPKSHAPIEYVAGVVQGAPHPEAARAFLAFLRGEAARAELAAAGFGLP